MRFQVSVLLGSVAGRGNPLCFDDAFTYEFCCESNNDGECWNGAFTAEFCCAGSVVVDFGSVSQRETAFWRTLACEFSWESVIDEGLPLFPRLAGSPCPERMMFGSASRFADAEMCAQLSGHVVLVHLPDGRFFEACAPNACGPDNLPALLSAFVASK